MSRKYPESSIAVEFSDDITVEAVPTGRKDDRGEIKLRVYGSDSDASAWLSPSEAKRLAVALAELADRAAIFSTRGFVGSDE